MKRLIWLFILIFLVVNLLNYILQKNEAFLKKFDPVHVGKVYSQSQYVLGPASKDGIGDDWLYAFAGYYYLFQGGDISSVNFEHPPLGKYLMGLSILFFGNENVINLIYFIFLLLFTYKISKLVNNSRFLASISVTILSFDPLFLDNLIRSMLDLPFTLFFIGGVYFYLMGLRISKYFYLSYLFWGMAFSTRFFPAFVILYIFMTVILVKYQKSFLKQYILASFLVPIIYLLSHSAFFIYHPSMIEFLRHKKWMLVWFTGTPVLYGNIWKNIFTGRYLDSTGQEALNNHWAVSIPVVVVSAMTNISKSTLKLNNLLIIYGICLVYLIYLTILTGGLQKFLMPIFPLLCVLAVDHSYRLYSIITTWKSRK